MSGKPLYKRTSPLKLFEVEQRGDLFAIVGPGLEWHSQPGQDRKGVELYCMVINHAALMGWQECHTTMMTSSQNVN